MKKPKKPGRKFVLIEVETSMSNMTLASYVRENVHDTVCGMLTGRVDVLQVHVNAAKKEPKR